MQLIPSVQGVPLAALHIKGIGRQAHNGVTTHESPSSHVPVTAGFNSGQVMIPVGPSKQ